jgi:hypothetical protein
LYTIQFPGISDQILGEENNKFMNAIGESVIVTIQETCDQTSQLLLKVLDGNNKAANLLANAVHSSDACHSTVLINDNINIEINLNTIGIWIDPIGNLLFENIVKNYKQYIYIYFAEIFRFNFRICKWSLG